MSKQLYEKNYVQTVNVNKVLKVETLKLKVKRFNNTV